MTRREHFPWMLGHWAIALAVFVGCALGHYFPWPGSAIIAGCANIAVAAHVTLRHFAIRNERKQDDDG